MLGELERDAADASVSRIARRAAAIARSLPAGERRASLERRATSAALSFDEAALARCLRDLVSELEALAG